MMRLAHLHTIVRAQVRMDERTRRIEPDAAREATLSPTERRALGAWRLARGTSGTTGIRQHPAAGSDEWTGPPRERR